MLILQRKAEESVVIGGDISITVLSIDSGHVRLAISAPEHIPILRSELLSAAQANRESVAEPAASGALLHLLGGAEADGRGPAAPLSPKRRNEGQE